ncbi:MAG: nuclear transport factor 2 family protein [Microbacteriaceae bacterium]|nr:nuclear transport factor 2 family protein [Microbacteriaceae bacterium]
MADCLHGRWEAFLDGYRADASLVCYGVTGRIESRDEFRLILETWVRDHNFTISSARSTDRRVQFVGTAAVFTHILETQFHFDGVHDRKFERETLVFEQVDGSWLCAHEHLSVNP